MNIDKIFNIQYVVIIYIIWLYNNIYFYIHLQIFFIIIKKNGGMFFTIMKFFFEKKEKSGGKSLSDISLKKFLLIKNYHYKNYISFIKININC